MNPSALQTMMRAKAPLLIVGRQLIEAVDVVKRTHAELEPIDARDEVNERDVRRQLGRLISSRQPLALMVGSAPSAQVRAIISELLEGQLVVEAGYTVRLPETKIIVFAADSAWSNDWTETFGLRVKAEDVVRGLGA